MRVFLTDTLKEAIDVEKDEIFEEDMGDEDMIFCPLLNETIPVGLCDDINFVLEEYCFPEDVPEVKDWEKARAICPTCVFI